MIVLIGSNAVGVQSQKKYPTLPNYSTLIVIRTEPLLGLKSSGMNPPPLKKNQAPKKLLEYPEHFR